MNILKRLLQLGAVSRTAQMPFRVGDRVRDPWGNKHTVTEVDPSGENGLGTFRTQADGGGECNNAMIAHGFTLLPPDEAGFSPPDFSVKRVRSEESAAGAYLRAGKIILCGTCITNYGGLESGPYQSLEITASNEDVGSALLNILAAARTISVPANLKDYHRQWQQELFRIVGVRSASRFHDGAVHCSISQTPPDISIAPSQNEGRHFSYLPKASYLRIPAASKSDEIGKALKEGFSRCT